MFTSVPSSAETLAPLIEQQSAWNIRLGRRTGRIYTAEACGSENIAPENAFRDPKNCVRGHCLFPDPSPIGKDFLPHTVPMHSCAFWAYT